MLINIFSMLYIKSHLLDVANLFERGQKIGVVIAVLVIIWACFFAYLIYLDKKINNLKK